METRRALRDGAHEIDMVINIGPSRAGRTMTFEATSGDRARGRGSDASTRSSSRPPISPTRRRVDRVRSAGGRRSLRQDLDRLRAGGRDGVRRRTDARGGGRQDGRQGVRRDPHRRRGSRDDHRRCDPDRGVGRRAHRLGRRRRIQCSILIFARTSFSTRSSRSTRPFSVPPPRAFCRWRAMRRSTSRSRRGSRSTASPTSPSRPLTCGRGCRSSNATTVFSRSTQRPRPTPAPPAPRSSMKSVSKRPTGASPRSCRARSSATSTTTRCSSSTACATAT